MKTFHLTIARVDESLFDGEVISATLPGKEGEFEVLAGHEAFVSELRSGRARIKDADGALHHFAISEHGIAEVSNAQATVLL